MRPTRRLSIGTLFYKRVFPVLFVVGGIVAAGFGIWNATMRAGSFMKVIPFVGVTAVGFAIIRFVAPFSKSASITNSTTASREAAWA
jgi:hypothetical protein